MVVVDRLATMGAFARMPLSGNLGGGLFELRLAVSNTARRITSRFTKDDPIILLTTFRKQRNNEREEITRARKIAAEYVRRNPRRSTPRPTTLAGPT